MTVHRSHAEEVAPARGWLAGAVAEVRSTIVTLVDALSARQSAGGDLRARSSKLTCLRICAADADKKAAADPLAEGRPRSFSTRLGHHPEGLTDLRAP